jgi:hypothetical protein
VRKFVLLLAAAGVLTVTAAALAGTNRASWSAKLTAAQEIPKQTVKAPAAKTSTAGPHAGQPANQKAAKEAATSGK